MPPFAELDDDAMRPELIAWGQGHDQEQAVSSLGDSPVVPYSPDKSRSSSSSMP